MFVSYASPSAPFTLKIPEGWSSPTSSSDPTFTDKYNSVVIHVSDRATAPTVVSVNAEVLPALRRSDPTSSTPQVTSVRRASGNVVLLTYEADSAINDVTGKTTRLAVEQYQFWRGGRLVTLTLAGPTGADNVDPWRTITDSFSWSS